LKREKRSIEKEKLGKKAPRIRNWEENPILSANNFKVVS